MSYLSLHIFFICLNIGFLTITDFSNTPLGGQTLPEYFNGEEPSGKFKDILQPTNSAGDGSILDGITQGAELANSMTYIMVNALTGGFIFDTINNTVLELPQTFVNGLKALLGLLLALHIFYLWSGRSTAKNT